MLLNINYYLLVNTIDYIFPIPGLFLALFLAYRYLIALEKAMLAASSSSLTQHCGEDEPGCSNWAPAL